MSGVTYSKDLFNSMMLRVSGGETLNRICKDNGFPDVHCAFEWVHKTAENSQEYARAVENRAAARAARIDDYGDMLLKGEITSDVARVLIDKERWQAGKENPKKYSDKQQIEITGKDGEPLSLRLIEAQQRLLKDITPKILTIANTPAYAPDDII